MLYCIPVQKTPIVGSSDRVVKQTLPPHSHEQLATPPSTRNATPKKIRVGGASTATEEGGHDTTCFRCGRGEEGGVKAAGGVVESGKTLILCDKTRCARVYHLACLNVSKLPHGQ